MYDIQDEAFLDLSSASSINMSGGHVYFNGGRVHYNISGGSAAYYDVSTSTEVNLTSESTSGNTTTMTEVYAIADSAAVAVGRFKPNFDVNLYLPIVWEEGNTIGNELMTLGSSTVGEYRASGSANALNADASIIVGESDGEAVMWDAARQVYSIQPSTGAEWSIAEHISGDSRFIYGRHRSTSDNATQGFRYDIEADAFTALNLGFGGKSDVAAVANNGRAAGTSFNGTTDVAVVWEIDGSSIELGLLSSSISAEEGGYSYATGISPNGEYVVGASSANGDNWEEHAFIRRGVMQDYTNLLASLPAIAGETELALDAQQYGVTSLFNGRDFACGEGQSFFSVFGGASNTGSGDGMSGRNASLGSRLITSK